MGTTRHTLFAFAILLFSVSASAQFDALPDSNATWTGTFWIGPGYPYEGRYYTYDEVSPDTLYNGQVFKKLRMIFASNGLLSPIPYAGAVQDNGLGQVFFWDVGAPDPFLLYDFDVLPGDTVEDVWGLWIQDVAVYSVDTVIVNGTPRKRIGVACIDQPGILGAYWIQGIGGTGGLLQTNACPSVSGTGELICMTANDTVQYGVNVGGLGDCVVFLGQLEEEAHEEMVAVYPNPAEDRLTIGSLGSGRVNVEVFGPDGRSIYVERLSGTELNIAALSPGCYWLKVREASGTVGMARFVKR